MSNTTIILIVALVVLFVLLFLAAGVAIPLWSIRKNKAKTEALKATGLQGEATVLQLEDTGARVNNNPRMNLLLEVRIPGYPLYQVTKTVAVPTVRMSQFHVGAIFPVLADPSQPDNPDKLGILLK